MVDNGSTENIKSICKDAEYIRIKDKDTAGVAYEAGLAWVKEQHIPYVVFLRVEDMLMPQALDKMLLIMQMTQSNIVSSFCVSNVKDEFNPGGCLHDHDSLTDYIYGKMYNVPFLEEFDIHFNNYDEVYFNILTYSLCSNEERYDIYEPLYYWNTNEAYMKNYRNYIMSVYYACDKLLKSNFGYDIYTMIGYIFRCYNCYEILKARNYKNLSLLDDKLSELICNKKIQKALCDKNMWKVKYANIKNSNQDTESVIIFPDSLYQWLYSLGFTKIKEEI